MGAPLSALLRDGDAGQGTPVAEEGIMTGTGEGEDRLGRLRGRISSQYKEHPTGCGGSFDELLCFELHHGGPQGTGLTFSWLVAKWGISLSLLGELIWDHCKGLEPLPKVNHSYTYDPEDGGWSEVDPRPTTELSEKTKGL